MTTGAILAHAIRDRISHGEYPDTGCDLCAGTPLAPDTQSCSHRCSCGRMLECQCKGGDPTAELWRCLAVAASDHVLYRLHQFRWGWMLSDADVEDLVASAKNAVTASRNFWLSGGTV